MQYLAALGRHADWRVALEQVLEQLGAARARPGTVTRPNLGLLYCTEALRPALAQVVAALRVRSGVARWAGASGRGVMCGDTAVLGEPALAVMLLQLQQRDFRVFSGAQRLDGWRAGAALVHADAAEADVDELLDELGARAGSLSGAVSDGVQLADGVLRGGISGVAFAPRVALTGGWTPGARGLLPGRAQALRAGLAVDMRQRPCTLHAAAEVRRDLVRLATEVRDELEQRRDARVAAGEIARGLGAGPRGAVYIAGAERGRAYFGSADAELAQLRRHLGDTALIGLLGRGEVAGGRARLASAVLLVFGDDPVE